MPRVGSLNGIIFKMYANDHVPPHVHAYYGEHEVLVVLATATVLQGSLPGPQQKAALRWVAANRETLEQKWEALRP